MKKERVTHQGKPISQHKNSKTKSLRFKSLVAVVGIMALSGAVSADNDFSTPKGVPAEVTPQYGNANVDGRTFHVSRVALSVCDSGCRTIITTPQSIVDKAKATVAKSGAEFAGNTSSGSFSGNGVSGVYEIRTDKIVVTITKKPIFIPWTFVEAKIRDFFG